MSQLKMRWVGGLVALLMLGAAPLGAAPAPALAAGGEAQGLNVSEQSTCFYTVRQGDTLAGIARSYGTTTQALARMNALTNPNRIAAGVSLVVPCDGTPPAGTCGTYVVRWGDTLAKIARRYGLTWQALAETNRLARPNLLFAGMSLQIPCSSSTGSDGSEDMRTFTSARYGYSVSYPSGWTVEAFKPAPSADGNPESITLHSNSAGLPRVDINVLTGAAPISGFEDCEENFVFAGQSACQIVKPGSGQTPAQVLWVFQRGNVHYLVAMLYEDPSTLPAAQAVAGSLQFTR